MYRWPLFRLIMVIVLFSHALFSQTLTAPKSLGRSLPPWVRPENDLGKAAPAKEFPPIALQFARSSGKANALERYWVDRDTPGSPDFHRVLSSQEIAARFGADDKDIQSVTEWMTAQHLRVIHVLATKDIVLFTGSAADISGAFQTEVHQYNVHGRQRLSISTEPHLPDYLAPLVQGIAGLSASDAQPLHNAAQPHFTSGPSHFLVPADVARIYDAPSNLTGSGVTIGILGRSRTDFTDFDKFRQSTGATFGNPTELVPTAYGGTDPGPAYTTYQTVDTSNQGEATLDVTISGGQAPGANLLLVVSQNSFLPQISYIVDATPTPAQLLNISLGECEANMGSSMVSVLDSLFATAEMKNITVLVASGDSGASECDTYFATPPASPAPNSINGFCSSSHVTCVGGTEFNDTANPSQYWSSANSAKDGSALGYIPEGAWNESYTWSPGSNLAAATGGGVSTFIPTPSYQSGTGVPAARSGRYTPDVALAAASHDGYALCFAAGGYPCNILNGFTFYGGTSAAAPDMSGFVALLDQSRGTPVGNINSRLYQMAASVPSAFHDITVATSGVGSCSVNTASMCNNSIPAPTGSTGGQPGYLIGTGYDEATGLGSLDVSVFINNYATTNGLSPRISVSPTTGTLGVTAFNKTGSGFTPNSTVTQSITYPSGGAPTVYTVLADASGNYTVTPPPVYSSQTGQYSETDTDTSGAKSNTTTWTVNPPTGPTAHFTMSSGGNTATDGGTLTTTASGGAAQVTFTSTSAQGTATISGYTWKSNGIQVCTTSSCTIGFAPSTDTITLTVTDGNSLTSAATGTLVVNTPPTGPMAHFTMSSGGNTATDGGTLTTTASGGAAQVTFTSTSAQGTATISGYTWKSNGIQVCTTSSCTIGFAPSTDTITLTVTDGNSLTSAATGTLVVNTPPTGPMAHFTMSSGGNTATDGGTLTTTASGGAAQVTFTSTSAQGTATISGYTWKSNGIQVCTTASCTIGFAPSTDTITLTVTDGNSLTSTATGTLVVNAAAMQDFSLSASPSSFTLAGSAAASSTLMVIPSSGGFPQSVVLSCSGAPAYASCSVNPASVTPGNSTGTASITVTTTARPHVLTQTGFALILLGFLPACWMGFRRRRLSGTMLGVVLFSLLILGSGCGTAPSPVSSGTPAGSYTLTITGTGQLGSATLTHTATVSLTVN